MFFMYLSCTLFEVKTEEMIMKKIILALLSINLIGLSYGTCFAEELSSLDSSPWQVRVRAIDVMPSGSSSTITGLGGKVNDIGSDTVPEFDITYFFTSHISSELILATTNHTVSATGTAIGNVDLGSVGVLPPTLTVQYHFLPDHVFNPYVGAGLNYTIFYNVDNGPVADSVEYSNGFAPALQLGADIALDDHWMINFDVKYIAIQTDAVVNVGENSYTSNVNINPFVYGIGIGYHF